MKKGFGERRAFASTLSFGYVTVHHHHPVSIYVLCHDSILKLLTVIHGESL